MQKTYKDDDRFKLSKHFAIGDKDQVDERKLREISTLDLSKRERKLLDKEEEQTGTNMVQEETDILWDCELDNLDQEKEKALKVLATIVPQSEVFLSNNYKSDSRNKQMHIKRFDPTKLVC